MSELPKIPVRAILTDLDGVVRIWPGEADERTEREAGLPAGAIRRAAFAADLLPGAITGRVRDEAWRRRVAERLTAQFPKADAERAVRLWSASAGTVDREVLELLRAGRSRAALVLVTNATSRLPRDLRALGLEREFDAVVNSSVVGCAKPEPGIFRAALDAAGVAAEEAVLIDDSAANVEAAVGLGMLGCPYRNVAQLRCVLEHHGLVPPAGGDGLE